MRLQGKVAVITGAGSGIGRAMATRFAAESAAIVVGDWNAARIDEMITQIQASGGAIVGAHERVQRDHSCIARSRRYYQPGVVSGRR
jgi:NAD(P)-dependent dehydrogenase (short-subunit alcohol dehydrogenase family)